MKGKIEIGQTFEPIAVQRFTQVVIAKNKR